MERSSFRLISEGINNWLAFYEREREKQTEKHAHAARHTTIAKSVVTTFDLIFFRLNPFHNARYGTSFQKQILEKAEALSTNFTPS